MDAGPHPTPAGVVSPPQFISSYSSVPKDVLSVLFTVYYYDDHFEKRHDNGEYSVLVGKREGRSRGVVDVGGRAVVGCKGVNCIRLAGDRDFCEHDN